MKAAIYARKSVAESGVSADAKSVTRQLENARKFAKGRGWDVVAEHQDDAKSGREFEKRPGLQALLRGAEARAFEVIVVAELKAIGREMFEVGFILKRMSKAGVSVFGYLEGRELTPKGGTDKLMSAVQSFADEDVSVKTSLRMRESHERLARAGRVTGGRLYGYKNVDVMAGTDAFGRPLRSHVDREIEPAEAAAVRRIFEMFVGGHGLKAIARELTKDGLRPPRANSAKQSLGAWAPSTVNAILHREAYSGFTTWGVEKKRDAWGAIAPTRNAADAVVRVPRPDLQIVTPELWRAAAARRAQTAGKAIRFADGRLSGRPRKGSETSLLAGLARCAVCGGGITRESTRYYCARGRHHGTHVCASGLRLDAAAVDEAVLMELEEHILQPGRVEEFLLQAEAEATGDQERRTRLEAELKDVARREATLLAALEGGSAPAAVLTRIAELGERREAITTELAAVQPVPRLAPKLVESRLAEWRRLLRGSVSQARAVLQRVIDGRITIRALGGGLVELEARTRFSGLFVGFVAEPSAEPVPAWVKLGDSRGHETVEASYEAVLAAIEARHVKIWRPWRASFSIRKD